MIARQVLRDEPPERAAPYSRSARTASVIRKQRARVGRYRSIGRITVGVAVATVMVLSYVLLVANITRTNYELRVAQIQERALEDRASLLDEQLDELTSAYRLERVAAKLGMREAASEAVVDLPGVPKVTAQEPRTLLSSIFGAR